MDEYLWRLVGIEHQEWMGIAMGESEGVGIRLRRMRAIKVFKVSQGWGVGWGDVGEFEAQDMEQWWMSKP